MTNTMEMVRATPGDVDVVVGILTEVAQWLGTKGMAGQWPPEIPRDFIAACVERGEVYLAMQGDEVVATVALQWSDPDVWGDVPDDAVYVHRLAVRRPHAGKGLGRRLLRWAEEMAGKHGKQYLRLDCWAENPVLVRYYAGIGFDRRGEVRIGTWRGVLYQRPVAKSPVDGTKDGLD